jgi:hypothetical protein
MSQGSKLPRGIQVYLDRCWHCAWFVPADLRIKEVCNTEHAPASVQVDALQFRPNLVLSGSLPNDEDNWQTVNICNQRFTVCRQNLHLFTKSLSSKCIYSLKNIEPVAECGLGTHCPPLASGLTLKGFIITGRPLWIFVDCMAGARRLQSVSNGEHRPSHWFPSQSESTTGNFGFLSQGWGRDFLLDSWVLFSFFLVPGLSLLQEIMYFYISGHWFAKGTVHLHYAQWSWLQPYHLNREQLHSASVFPYQVTLYNSIAIIVCVCGLWNGCRER